MARRICVLLAAVIMSGIACRMTASAAAQPVSDLTVEGRVLVEATGEPVAGARVTLDAQPGRQTLTDRNGRYSFSSVPRAEQTISVRAIGYIPERRDIHPSCTVAVVDDAGRVLTPSRCTPSPERLDFRLRPDIQY
jgi:hypothetical protein